jgi:putative Ca2+/H+ antiporter (TMEM165/GDT1 family)
MKRPLKSTILILFFCIFMLFGTVTADTDEKASTEPENQKADDKTDPKLSTWSAFVAAVSSMIVSELGDKTFFIAAIMAMRYNRLAVYAGAISALVLMTGISVAFGWVVPKLIDPKITQIIVTVLFFFFGAKLLYDVYSDDGKEGENEEAAEVEAELDKVHTKFIEQKKGKKPAKDEDSDIELKTSDDNPEIQVTINKDDPENPIKEKKPVKSGIAAILIFWQALTLTFLGEWGDRSQIATIALASQSNAAAVFFGASLGHAACTGLAVIGGKYLAKSISERWVNISGGILFLLFGIHNVFYI